MAEYGSQPYISASADQSLADVTLDHVTVPDAHLGQKSHTRNESLAVSHNFDEYELTDDPN